VAIDKDKIVNDLLKEYPIYDLVAFDELNISQKLQDNPYQVIRFQDQLLKEKIRYEELEELQEKLVGELYHKYRFQSEEELSNKEIEKYYLPKDPKYLKMKEILRKQKIRIAFFELCVKGLDRQYWSMKEFANKRI
jgi:acyl carrier protein phosphodiesterase